MTDVFTSWAEVILRAMWIAQFRYIKIQLETKAITTGLKGII